MFNLFSRFVLICVCLFCVATAHAHNKVVVIPLFGDEAPEVPEAPIYALGDEGPGGGTVFHVTDGGLHGMEYAPAEDWVEAPWGCNGTDVQGVENINDGGSSVMTSGTGLELTTTIAVNCLDDPIPAALHALTYIWPTDVEAGGFLPDVAEARILGDYFLDFDDIDFCLKILAAPVGCTGIIPSFEVDVAFMWTSNESSQFSPNTDANHIKFEFAYEIAVPFGTEVGDAKFTNSHLSKQTLVMVVPVRRF